MNLNRFGIPGIVGIGLIVFAASFASGAALPAWQEFQHLQEEGARLAQLASSLPMPVPRTADVGTPWSATRAPELVLALARLADEAKLPLEQATYRFVEAGPAGYYEVTFTTRGSYPALRSFLHDALALSPSATLSELGMQRANSVDPLVTAGIGLVYPFVP